MKFIKSHKMLVIFLSALIIFLIIILFLLKQIMFDTSKSQYGNRLDGIEKVEINKNEIKKIETELKEIDKVKSVSYDLKGRLINLLIEVTNETTLEEAREYGNKILEYLTEDEKSYYDIQVFLSNEDEKQLDFPVIGYKHKTREAILWD